MLDCLPPFEKDCIPASLIESCVWDQRCFVIIDAELDGPFQSLIIARIFPCGIDALNHALQPLPSYLLVKSSHYF
jgi:hypothetical protein